MKRRIYRVEYDEQVNEVIPGVKKRKFYSFGKAYEKIHKTKLWIYRCWYNWGDKGAIRRLPDVLVFSITEDGKVVYIDKSHIRGGGMDFMQEIESKEVCE